MKTQKTQQVRVNKDFYDIIKDNSDPRHLTYHVDEALKDYINRMGWDEHKRAEPVRRSSPEASD